MGATLRYNYTNSSVGKPLMSEDVKVDPWHQTSNPVSPLFWNAMCTCTALPPHQIHVNSISLP